jgi:hypothetical protein
MHLPLLQFAPNSVLNLRVMRPQAEGRVATALANVFLPRQQSDVSRDLQSALLLCCSVALSALWIQSRLHNHESPWYIG